MEENDKTTEVKKLTDKIRHVLNPNATGDEDIEGAAEKIFDELHGNDSFNQEIEQILAILNEQTMDLTQLQSKIILLIKKYINQDKKLAIEPEIDEKLISHNVAEVSHYLMQQRSDLIKNTNNKLASSKDKYYGMSSKSRADLKLVVKNFAVYQVYKFLNPKKIAGETSKENFVHNMIIGGKDQAKHYKGGSAREVAGYSPEFIKKLETAHKSFKANRTI